MLNFENLGRWNFDGVGDWGIPLIGPTDLTQVPNCEWISFNFAKTAKDRAEKGIHFFLDDYQFLRPWNTPDRYLELLKQFKCVCSPDFSTFVDMPPAMQIYNHFRKHWLAAYWQTQGIKVIPTISWSDERSWAWCFDGEPVEGVVAVSTVGTQGNKKSRELFKIGFEEMKRRLRPQKILLYGMLPKYLHSEDIIHLPPYYAKIRERSVLTHGR